MLTFLGFAAIAYMSNELVRDALHWLLHPKRLAALYLGGVASYWLVVGG
jgi:hypothetical protein